MSTQYYVASSLDGFIADPEGRLDWLFQFNAVDGIAAHYERFRSQLGAIAMGARTYEFILAEEAEAWPYAGIPTWIFTHRELPRVPGADLRFTEAPVEVVHAEMRAAAGEKNLWLVGGGHLVAEFAAQGLVDELLVTITPVTLGGGAPLLPLRLTDPFELTEVTRFGAGMVELRYRLRA